VCHCLLVMHCFHCDQAQTCVKVGASFSSLVTGCNQSQVLLSLVSACESTLPLCISNFNIATLSLLVPICQSPKLYEMGTVVNLHPPPPTPEKNSPKRPMKLLYFFGYKAHHFFSQTQYFCKKVSLNSGCVL